MVLCTQKLYRNSRIFQDIEVIFCMREGEIILIL